MSTTTIEDQLTDVRRRIARLRALAQTDAVEEELRSWDTYLERLQATAVAKAGTSRERAEAAIADVRSRRIAVYDRLAQAWQEVDGAWREQRNQVSAARDALEQKADELSANFN